MAAEGRQANELRLARLLSSRNQEELLAGLAPHTGAGPAESTRRLTRH